MSEQQDKCPGCKWGFKNKSDYWCAGCYDRVNNPELYDTEEKESQP